MSALRGDLRDGTAVIDLDCTVVTGRHYVALARIAHCTWGCFLPFSVFGFDDRDLLLGAFIHVPQTHCAIKAASQARVTISRVPACAAKGRDVALGLGSTGN